MESHESIFVCIVVFSFNRLFVHILWYGIVDIQQGYDIITDCLSDEFRKCSVDIYFAGYRDSASCQTAVYITRHKSELCLECRPAFCGKCNVFFVSSVSFDPVKKSNLVLSQFRKNFWFAVAITKFFCHICCNFCDTWITFMFLERFKQIQFGVLFDLDTQVVKLFDWCITCQEVIWTRTKADDLQVFYCHICTCDWQEVMDHICTVICISYRIFWDIVSANISQLQVVACIQHTTVSITTSLNQVIL